MGRCILLLLLSAALLMLGAGWGGTSTSLDLVLRATRKPTTEQLARAVDIEIHRAHLLDASGVDIAPHGADEVTGFPAPRGTRWFYYAAKGRPELTGADLVRSQTRAASDPPIGMPVVLIQFGDRGKDAFARMTATDAKRGKRLWSRAGRAHAQHYFQHFAIVVDNRIITAPAIDFHQYPDGIDALNGIQITGLGGATEAKSLALLLRSGTLPVPFAVQR